MNRYGGSVLITLFSVGCLLGIGGFITGCHEQNDIYEHQQSISDYEWDYDEQPEFEVTIPDTQAHYNIYVLLRHNDNYPFKNLWLILHTETPSGETEQERTELTLARKSGKWYGAGIAGVWEVLVPIKEKHRFEEQGTYTFQLEQHMRKNPLPAIMNVGLRIERIPNKLTLQK
jgi:gliding motility-associated lipoprotein GldH